MKNPKFIFITGGVLSGVGKGITAASVGKILQARGFKVNLQKCDPYLNLDAGTLNPGEHGEVFVTEDGAETDLDIGHYERFLNRNFTGQSSLMAGRVFTNVLNAERRGEYLGKTIQIIPHITNEIQRLIIEAAQGFDIHIVEIGGTVGDYEGIHFIEAIRQMKRKVGEKNVLYIHVVFLPYLITSAEIKTKPAQNSIRTLKELGIIPDVLCARSDYPITHDIIAKLSLYGDVEEKAIIPLITAKNIYEVPFILEKYHLAEILLGKLNLENRKPNFDDWKLLLKKITNSQKGPVAKIAIVGKYMTNKDTYMSVVEALKAAAWHINVNLKIIWVDSEKLTQKNVGEILKEIDGILVPGGFGKRGIEGKILAIQYARENKIPYLGLCLGMQLACIEFARNVIGLKNANSTEFNPQAKDPVIYIMPSQRNIKQKGGTMRLGAWPCKVLKGTLAYKIYKKENISERHRHRYEFNNKYREIFEKYGMIFSGVSQDNNLVEIIELSSHPFFIATQAHPEFKSRPTQPHPLFLNFIKAALNK